MIFLLTILKFACALEAPYLTESKVQGDIENLLSRLIPKDQYLVQVSSAISTKTEKKLIEGEILQSDNTPVKPKVPAMPGFTPDRDWEETNDKRAQTREVYRLVETPVLNLLNVQITFDEKVPAKTVNQGKMLITKYLNENFPGKSRLSINSIPMFHEEKEVRLPLPEKEPPINEKLKEILEQFLNNQKETWQKFWYALIGLLGLCVFILLRVLFNPERTSTHTIKQMALEGTGNMNVPFLGGLARTIGGKQREESLETKSDDKRISKRKKIIEKFLNRPLAFRLYYKGLTTESQSELYSILSGPAFDNLLTQLKFSKPQLTEIDPTTKEELLNEHEKTFEEFVQGTDWESRQFFGFLNQVTDEQLLALSDGETPLVVSTILRYLRPEQSALVLDSLSQNKRRDVFSYHSTLASTPVTELIRVEKEVREIVQKMPSQGWGQRWGREKGSEDKYWGEVLTESHHQDEILEDLEKTNPGIMVKLSRYRFKLEDAATLPENILQKVLNNIDNDEIAMALSGLPETVAEVILDAMPEKRQRFIQSQMVSYRDLPAERLNHAKVNLTRKFQEVLK